MSSIFEPSERDKEIKKKVFEQQFEYFIKIWGPQDRYELSQFDAQLMNLIRQVYADAQEPLLKVLSAHLAYAPMIIPKDNK